MICSSFFHNSPLASGPIEFINIIILEGTWADLPPRLKEELHWRGNQPRISIANSEGLRNRRAWIEDEVAELLDGGHDPFVTEWTGSEIPRGIGVVKDDF